MIYTEYLKIVNSVVHIVGNKSFDEGLFLSDEPLSLDDDTGDVLIKYLLSPFKHDGYCQFWHESELQLNEVYFYAKNIFEDNNTFYENSKSIARHLYAQSIHPKIKTGEVCIVLFKNIIVETTTCEAIGIFKSENKDTFLQIKKEKDHTTMQSETGINVNRLDKGCLIFNTNKESGFLVSVVDNTNKSGEAKYWINDFLKARPIANSYNQTETLMTLTREFVSLLPKTESKVERANYINRSKEILSSNKVNVEQFASGVFRNEETRTRFAEYKDKRQSEIGVSLEPEFEVSSQALKQKNTSAMTTIKLDKNFDLNIHGGEQFIECGFDEQKGMRYYKLFFNEER